ncbi:MAG TPA: CvpA family protein [Anaerolineae bacterium]|nr:CvpA family protein [Anaerolineae bacterium]
MRLTFFDVLFFLALIGGAAFGFYRGVFRQASATLVLYISTVVSTLAYRGLSRMLVGLGESNAATDVLSFILLMGIMNLMFMLMVNDLIGHISIERMKIWVNFGGMLFGFVNTAVWCAVILIIIRSSTAGEEWIGYEAVRRFLQGQTRGSWMAYVFRPSMRFLLAIIRPWLFGHDLPPLLINSL